MIRINKRFKLISSARPRRDVSPRGGCLGPCCAAGAGGGGGRRGRRGLHGAVAGGGAGALGGGAEAKKSLETHLNQRNILFKISYIELY